MKAKVRTKDGTEYIGGDVSLIQGFVRIKDAKQRELELEEVDTDAPIWKIYLYLERPTKFVQRWKIIKKKTSITLPESQVLWIEEGR